MGILLLLSLQGLGEEGEAAEEEVVSDQANPECWISFKMSTQSSLMIHVVLKVVGRVGAKALEEVEEQSLQSHIVLDVPLTHENMSCLFPGFRGRDEEVFTQSKSVLRTWSLD